ncbi:MAG: D-2-hydroxyacid dehydrogenase [Xanthobacteraceae bacterium]
MRLVISSPVSRDSFEQKLGGLGGIKLTWAEAPELPALSRSADAIVMAGLFYGDDLARALDRPDNPCRWLQLITAGYEQLVTFGVPRRITVSTAGSVWSPVVAEQAMLLMLALARRMTKVVAAQGRREWDNTIRRDMDMLGGGRLTIVGMGSIGSELAKRAKAFGMTITGVNRSGRPHPAADRTLPTRQLREALSDADFVVVAAPLASDTVGLIGAAELAACPRHAIVVNVGRGAVIDSAALLRALNDGVVAGAGLDVTDPEPLPPDSPLWAMPNVIVSPHIGGAAPERYYERLVDHVLANTRAWMAGAPISDRVTI